MALHVRKMVCTGKENEMYKREKGMCSKGKCYVQERKMVLQERKGYVHCTTVQRGEGNVQERKMVLHVRKILCTGKENGE